jgi:ribosomal protein S18 acetylase RimI-like enzyme
MTASEVDIVPGTEPDLRQLFALAQSTFAGAPGWDDERVLETLLRDVVFVAREEQKPAGYVALRPEDRTTIVVEQVLVAPGHERRGIGHLLLEHAEGYAIAQHAHRLRIVVESDNWPAQRFYRRSGFVPVAEELFELALPRAG